MMKKIQKLFAVILVAVLVLSAAPVSGFVGIELPAWLDFGTKSSALDATGQCGDNVTYTFDASTGTLTIRGTGTMQNYSSDTSPFCSNSTIKTVVIESGVTSIGDYAFYYCTGLTSVTIPDSVTSIDNRAFSGCSGLTSVTIPDSVTSIGTAAFYGCTGLTSVNISSIETWFNISFSSGDSNPLYYAHNLYLNGTLVTDLMIPDNVTSIGDYAFYGCTGLTSVTIPDSVTTIGIYAFNNCTGLERVNISSVTSWCGIRFISTSSNPLYYAHYLYVNGSLVTDLMIPDSVTRINGGAFVACTCLTSVTIPDSVTTIGTYAFYNCTGLTSVTIPDSVTTIGTYAFYNCTGLTSVTIPDSVTSIGGSAFYGCTGLTSVTIPDSVTNIGEGAFGYVANVIYHSTADGSLWGARSINGYVEYPLVYLDSSKTNLLACSSAIQGEIGVPSYVTSIGRFAFYYCTGLTSVTIPDSVTSIGEYAFSLCEGLTSVTISDSVMSIGEGAFYECTGLTSVTIPDGVTTIGTYAFYNCAGLTSVTIPESVTSIGGLAFYGCSNLTDVYYSGSETDWNSVSVSGQNESLQNATIHFNYGHSHTYELISFTDATCTEEGTAVYTCSGCEDTYTEVIAKKDHTLSDWMIIKNPTCTTTGIRVKICTTCLQTIVNESLPKAHSFGDWAVTVQPTCTEDGEETRFCSLCGESETRAISALGHNYQGVVTPPTCTEQGYTTYTCSRCGDSYVSDYVDAKGHTYSEWMMLINPTVTQTGKMIRICPSCGIVLDEMNVPMLIDNRVTGITVSAEKKYMNIGETTTITAQIKPVSATNRNVLWTSSDPDIAIVNNGAITAVSPGKTVIIAQTEDCGFKDFCIVQVSAITAKNGAYIDNDNGYVYGLTSNLNNVDDYIDVCDDSMTLSYSTEKIGTGTDIFVVQGDTVINTFHALIFGDVNGDGYYDGQDAFIVNCIANGLLTKEQVGDAKWLAADCNHDGEVNSSDVLILEQAGLLLANVDQSKSQEELMETDSYIEYLNLIDQNPMVDDTTEEPINEPTEPAAKTLIERIIEIVKTVITFIRNMFPII